MSDALPEIYAAKHHESCFTAVNAAATHNYNSINFAKTAIIDSVNGFDTRFSRPLFRHYDVTAHITTE